MLRAVMRHSFHPDFVQEFLGVLFAILGILILILLAPGILVNYLTDRLPSHPHGLAFVAASARDWLTWVISLFFWGGCVAMCIKVKKQ